MADASQDIYRLREKDRSDFERGRDLPDQDEWLRRTSRNRIATASFIVGILVFLGILVAIILFQQRMLRAARKRAAAAAPLAEAIQPVPAPAARVAVNASDRMLFDEFQDLVPEKLPEEGDIPLTAGWVKQAAYHLNRGEAAYRSDRWREAIASYTKAARILPGVDGIAGSLGLCHLRLEQYAEAAERFGEEIRHGGETAALLNNLGVAQMGQDAYADAEANFLRATERDPDYAPAQYNLGLLQYRGERMADAEHTFARAADLDPQNADIANMRAMALMKLDRWAEAAAVLEANVERTPDVPVVFFRLAEALAHAGKPDAALAALRKAVALLDPRTALARLNQKEFDLLREQEDFQALVMELGRPPT